MGLHLASSTPPKFDGVSQAVEAAIAAGAFPGAVVLVGRGADVVFHAAHGVRSLEGSERPPMLADTVFDLASLTKPLATTIALMLLMREDKVRLADRVPRFIPNFGVHGKTHVTVRHLLSHSSGLAAWRAYHRDVLRAERQGKLNSVASTGSRALVYESIHRERLEYEPGTRSLYSDLGFLLLGELIELLTHAALDRYCHDRIFRPFGLQATGFVDLSRLRVRKLEPVVDMIAPTERCPWRQRTMCGQVHDDNAWAMGGVAGHAGLFANATDVHTIVARLRACWRGEDDFVPQAMMREMWTKDPYVPGTTWALGWDTPTPGTSSAGSRVSANAVGHLGFTGTSVWIDLERDAHVILLTNRVHPTRANDRIREWRPKIHDAVWDALDA